MGSAWLPAELCSEIGSFVPSSNISIHIGFQFVDGQKMMRIGSAENVIKMELMAHYLPLPLQRIAFRRLEIS